MELPRILSDFHEIAKLNYNDLMFKQYYSLKLNYQFACLPHLQTPDKFKISIQESQNLMNLCIIHPSTSSWFLQHHMIPQKEFSLRMTLRWLSQVKICYGFGSVSNFKYLGFYQLRGMSIFSEIDLIRAYNEIPFEGLQFFVWFVKHKSDNYI